MNSPQPPTSPSPHHRHAGHVLSLIDRLRLNWLLAHLPPKIVWAVYVFLNSFITIALLTSLALGHAQPVCLSLTWSDGLSVLLYAVGGILNSTERGVWSCHRAALRIFRL